MKAMKNSARTEPMNSVTAPALAFSFRSPMPMATGTSRRTSVMMMFSRGISRSSAVA
jgi:hypothetical protein